MQTDHSFAQRPQLLKPGVGVEKLRHRNVFRCEYHRCKFFLLTSAKWWLPQWVLSVG